MLRIENLKKNFGGIKAVNGCSFKAEPKKITALVGPNGSGKTTIFNIISGILKADSGEIFFCEKRISKLSPEKISNLGIARLFQQPKLFSNLTVKENLLMVFDNNDTHFWENVIGITKDNREKEERVQDLLKSVGMQGFETQFARDLSYGQKRLVEILRALMKPHRLLMLDEPIAGVTPILRKEMSNLFGGLRKKGDTILLIEHDMKFVFGIADEIIVMDKGVIIAEGNAKNMKNNPKVIETYLGDQDA
jgi:ABC-type branched-subunit amino acid transport system ATPase component